MKRLLIFMALASSLAFAQGSRRDDSALSTSGRPIPNPTVRVCAENATGIPCSPLATIYSDKALTTEQTNPYTGDSFGNYSFYAAPGWYQIQVSGAGVSPYTYKVLLAPDVSNMGAVAGSSFSSTATNPASAGVIRLNQSDQVCWRNEANTGDVCIGKDDSDALTGITGLGDASSLTTATANPAATGVIKLADPDQVCWRNAANSGDVCVLKDGSDRIVIPGSSFVTNSNAISFDIAQSNAPRMTWTSYSTGTFASTSTINRTRFDKPISVRRITVFLQQAGAGCTTEPQIALRVNGVDLQTITITNGQQFLESTGLNLSAAADQDVDVRVVTAAAGCTTNPSAPNVTVHYTMQ